MSRETAKLLINQAFTQLQGLYGSIDRALADDGKVSVLEGAMIAMQGVPFVMTIVSMVTAMDKETRKEILPLMKSVKLVWDDDVT